MSAERFSSGVVLERALPVLTFATDMRVTNVSPKTSAARERQDTPTPGPVALPAGTGPRQTTLPVIPRIVRRTMIDSDGMFVRLAARAAAATRRSALGGMLLVAFVLASLGASAGIAMRSLSDPSQPMFSSPAPVPARASDATATEHALERAPSLPRVEQAAGPGPATGAIATERPAVEGSTASRTTTAVTRRGVRGDAPRGALGARGHAGHAAAGGAVRGAPHGGGPAHRTRAPHAASRGGAAVKSDKR